MHWPSCSDAQFKRISLVTCPSQIAALIVGEVRDFVETPVSRGNRKWSSLSAEQVWRGLQETIVASNGPADLLLHTWNGTLARRFVSSLPKQPCATVCEQYGEEYMQRILSNFTGFRLIGGRLRFRDKRETPHLVDFFYKRYAGLRVMQHVERQRNLPYRAVLMARPDVVFLSKAPVVVPTSLQQRTVYVYRSDHRRDSSGPGASSDPISRGLCGENPSDWFAFGDRNSMGMYLSAFPALPQLNSQMHSMPGGCDWWKCHNFKRNGTLLINAEGYLGIHLRNSGLGCRDISVDYEPRVSIALPGTRRRDWVSSAASERALLTA